MRWVKVAVRMLRRDWLAVGVLALVLGLSTGAAADARTDFLIRMLSSSSQFRVRTQAALALGGQQADSAVVAALTGALRDEHPAVRAASAAALERLKDPTAIAALKSATSDSDSSVRSAVRSAIQALESSGRTAVAPAPPPPSGTGPATFYVGVGVPGSQIGLSPTALRGLREHVAQQVGQIDGVRLAPENEDRRAADKVIGAGKLVGFYIDSSVTNLETKPDGSVRAQVSVVIGTYPGRDIRAMLSGAATLSGGGSDESAKVQAIQAAFTGALRKLPQALQAGLARAQ